MGSEKKLITVSVSISVSAAMEQSSIFLSCCMDLWSTKWSKKSEGIKLTFLCDMSDKIKLSLIHYDL